ncbi:MAG: HAD-IB family phosphatase [Candidatus Paceibacterota bacterium]|jgi:5'-nucleotidase
MKKILQKFAYRDEAKVLKKMEKIAKEGERNLHFLLDFDRTLTPSDIRSGQDATTWGILESHLSEETAAEIRKLYEKYRPLELQNKMTPDLAVEWWEGSLDVHKKNGTKWSDITKDIEEKMAIRPYAKEFFRTCEEKKIPAVIISAGIRDIIELWFQKFDIRPAALLSTNLFFDENGRMSGWEKDSLVHTLNKSEVAHKELGAIMGSRPNIILVGDSLDDASMAEGDENVLRIMIDDPRKDDKRDELFYAAAFQKFDLAVKGESLEPLMGIFELFRERK